MLKEASFSPALPRSAETLFSPTVILASINTSTCHARVRLGVSLAAASLARLREHPPRYDCVLVGVCVAVLRLCFVTVEGIAAEWSAITEAKVLYTDNAFEFSAARRLRLSEDPSQPTIVPLTQPSDTV